MAEIQSKIISCPKCGGYYDSSKYQVCPYCGGTGASTGAGSFQPTTDPFAVGVQSTVVDPAPVGAGAFSPTIDPGASAGAVNPNMGATIMPGTAPVNDNMMRTMAMGVGDAGTYDSPVVGWLVAVGGPGKGADYRIHGGYNTIGRSEGDIRLTGDPTVSSVRDSTIVYIPQTRQFYVAHDQGKNVLMLNNAPVLGGSLELHAFDRIQVGMTQLLFVPLCGPDFSWEEETK